MGAVFGGVVAGGVSALPTLAALRAGSRGAADATLRRALVLGLAPFALLQTLLVVVVAIDRPAAVPFGTAAVLVYLACVSAGALAAWRRLR